MVGLILLSLAACAQSKATPGPVATTTPTPRTVTTIPSIPETITPPPLTARKIEKAFPSLPPIPRMVHLTHAGDGTGRLWAVFQSGAILVFPNDQSVSTTEAFLDIRRQVNSQGEEEGLLGLTFSPNYVTNGYFYVNYTAANPRRSIISRFSVSATNPNRADPQSELILLEVSQPFSNHNGGTVAFGPDGYLYIGLGDGGSRGDPSGNGQNTATLLGSILRLDVSQATAREPYRIPTDNPFMGVDSGARGEIWAYGLRNPWKFSFDPVSGDLWAADVGQNDYEEVDIIRPGANYGWNIMEGAHCYPSTIRTCDRRNLQLPIIEYTHDEGCSITGGYVYRGRRLPALEGAYVYADFCSGRIWALRYDGSKVTDHALLTDTPLTIPSFGLDENGEIFILAFDGNIYRFAY